MNNYILPIAAVVLGGLSILIWKPKELRSVKLLLAFNGAKMILKNIKKPLHKCEGVRRRRRHTLPPMAVPSALVDLTSLFGMGRGEPYCYNHLDFWIYRIN